MKRILIILSRLPLYILRIIYGLPVSLLIITVGTYLWMRSNDEETWLQGPCQNAWYMASGQWNKLPF